jgi:hypothetical protein
VPRPKPSARQLEILRWIADGGPHRAWPDESHKLSARALQSRGLARVTRKGKRWHAVLSEDGRHYLDHGTYPDRPAAERETVSDQRASRHPSEEAARLTARRAIRQAATSTERRSLSAARIRAAQPAAHPSLLKDIPMRYKIIVSRVQTAERHVRATSEEDAIRKVQEELERPYGFLGGWTTIGTDMDIVTTESPLGDSAPQQVSQDGLVSTGGSNWPEVILGIISEEELCEHFCWRPESEDSTGPVIYLVGHDLKIANVTGDLSAFREVLPQQPVGILIGSPLPRRVRMREIHRDIGREGESGVLGHLDALGPR